MNHDVHGIVTILERIGKRIFLYQLHTAQADVAADHGQRDRLKGFPIAGAIDAKPAADLEGRPVPATSEKGAVRREQLAGADVSQTPSCGQRLT
ncbi:hypothetical protein IVB05_08810 [Bradyrhizobium sp. 170]|nr:hypothetical protein IVB05_08810 [Bradyrhizobium sp. 170]